MYCQMLHQSRGVSGAFLWIFQPQIEVHCRITCSLDFPGLGKRHWHPQGSRQISGYANVSKQVRPVWRDLQFQDCIRQLINLVNRHSQLCIRWQFNYTGMVVGNAQFFFRTEHAIGLHSTEFRFIDRDTVKSAAHACQHANHASPAVRGAADNLDC